MSAKHTPGPWEVSKHGTPDYAPQFGIYAADAPNDLAIVEGNNAAADAHLIASAPDLLAALEMILNPSPHYGATQAHRDHIAAARSAGLAAIAKAKGTAA